MYYAVESSEQLIMREESAHLGGARGTIHITLFWRKDEPDLSLAGNHWVKLTING